MHPLRTSMLLLVASVTLFAQQSTSAAEPLNLRLDWHKNILTISGPRLRGEHVRVHYLEAYCRPRSTDRDWGETVIGHTTELISASDDGQQLELRCTLADGVIVEHQIRMAADGVEFRLTATNPTSRDSQAHWAQPCIRVDKFTGGDQQSYLGKCFVFYDGELTRMPTPRWATEARYTPGQVWCPAGVDRDDVNPRPLSPIVPSHGLIGCFSADEKMILASAWQPYQELFQGVIVCVHSDFRIGGLAAGESKDIRGKIYLMPADVDELLAHYRRDFPEHSADEQP